MDRPLTDMYDLLAALEAVVKAAESSKREALAQTIDAYCKDFSDDFFWAVGPRAPTFLSRLLQTIDSACHSNKCVSSQDAAEDDASVELPKPLLFIFG
jgi:hypothetical protein